MDYTKVPRKLIYEDRANLEDFFVDQTGTLDAIMYEKITKSDVCTFLDAAERLLDCYNDAYYITTIVLMENRPSLYVARYLDIVYSKYDKRGCTRHFAALTMAMVYNYLQTDKRYQDKDNALLKYIWNYHVKYYNDKQIDGEARFFFFDNVLPLIDVKKHEMRDVFNPRPIQNVVLFEDAETILLGQGLDYVMNSIISLRKTEDAIQCFDELIQKLKRADIIGKGKLIKEVEDCKKEFLGIREEPPIRKGKHGNLIETPQEEEVADVTTYSRENELETKVQVLQEELKSVKAENTTLQQKVSELSQPVHDLTAQQKVRMELALRLLQKAGMTDEVLAHRGNLQKAARVMSCLLDIKNDNARNNPAQTCATYLSSPDLSTQRHQKTIAELNPLLATLGVDIQL